MDITVKGGEMPRKEMEYYIDQIKKANPDKEFNSFDFTLDGKYVDVHYTYNTVAFERIRRITGYLVGSLDRFNNAKRAEVADRVKHFNLSDIQPDGVNTQNVQTGQNPINPINQNLNGNVQSQPQTTLPNQVPSPGGMTPTM